MRVELRIGGAVFVGDDVANIKLTESINDDAKLRADIRTQGAVDFAAPVELDEVGPVPKPLYRGWVTSAEPFAGGVHIEARVAPWLDEGAIPGWVVRASSEETVYSIGRFVGMEADKLDIHGLDLVAEGFLIVAPVRDVRVEIEFSIADVNLTPNRELLTPLLDFVDDVAMREEFLGSSAWAISKIADTKSLYEAEASGISAIDGALDRLALDAHFAAVQLPDGRRRRYLRRDRLGDPSRTDLILVRGQSGRAWLRNLGTPVNELGLQTPERQRLDLTMPGQAVRYDLALAAWRRSLRARDRIAASVALWEALEFYSAGTAVGGELDDETRDKLIAAVPSLALSDAQAGRVVEVFKQFLNMPSAMDRLRAALDRDRIPYSDGDIRALRAIRRPRTQAQHGDPPVAPSEEDLEHARGVVSRVLAYAGSTARSTR